MSDGVKAAIVSGVFAVIVALLTVFSRPISERVFPERVPVSDLTTLDDAGPVAPSSTPRRDGAARVERGDEASAPRARATDESEVPPAEPPAEPRATRSPSAPLAGVEGVYTLRSYAINGAPQPLRGEMRLERAGSERFNFVSQVVRTDRYSGPLPYYGAISRSGGTWYVELASPVDPEPATWGPVANDISYAGGVLTFRSAYGHVVVWDKQ
jgi:hypothetical protein